MRQHKTFILAAAVATLSLAPRANALDLTGEWTGKLDCVLHVDGQPDTKVKNEVVARISQSGSNVVMVLDGDMPSVTTAGITLTDGVKLDKGYVPLVDCSAYQAGVPNFINLKAATKVDGKGKLKGTLAVAIGGSPATMGTCKVTLKRTTTVDPGVTGCSFPVQ